MNTLFVDRTDGLTMSDTWQAFYRDLYFIHTTRGPLRNALFVRSHFWRRLRELQARNRGAQCCVGA
jgi:hypothetical protein